MPAKPDSSAGEVTPPELSDLAARIEGLSPRLEVVAFRKPGWQKQATTPIFMPGYSVEVRDREDPETYLITTEKLFAAGVTALDQTQRQYVRSMRWRMLALLFFFFGIFALTLTTGAGQAWITWLAVVVFIGAGVWLWRRSRQARPAGWPGLRESMGLMFGARPKARP
jgi:LPXTG-motif cell wall-anchored protein